MLGRAKTRRGHGMCLLMALAAIGSTPANPRTEASDGSIVGWGSNDGGECAVPEPNKGFMAIAAGEHRSLGIRAASEGLPIFIRGDVNASTRVNIADAIFILVYLFARGAVPSCLDAADADDSGNVDIADAIALLGHLFDHAGPLPPPFGRCGGDPTEDDLGCNRFPPCGER